MTSDRLASKRQRHRQARVNARRRGKAENEKREREAEQEGKDGGEPLGRGGDYLVRAIASM